MVQLHKLRYGQKVRDGISLWFREPLDLFADGKAGPLKEGCKQRVVPPGNDLLQQGDLIGGLVPEDEDVHDVCPKV
jgi:hypothetical protein